MAEIDYSNEAINVRHIFLGVDIVVYVEGQDDIVFWSVMFSKIKTMTVAFESVGSCEKIDDLIEKVEKNEVRIIAARDRDYLYEKKKQSKSPLVIYTAGYSIENTLIVDFALAEIVTSLGKQATINANHAQTWLNNFTQGIKILLELDLASQLSENPQTILGDNCTRFMLNEESSLLSAQKVQTKADIVSPSIESINLGKARKYMKGKNLSSVIKGHFLMSAALKYVSETSKNLKGSKVVSLPNEALFTLAITILRSKFNTKHPHYYHYKRSLKKTVNQLGYKN